MENLTELTINLENLSQNIKNLKSLLKSETKFLAVVKANAYGHGIVECSKAAIEAGADWLGVINIDEAMALRGANIHKPILILGEVLNNDLRTAANKDVSVPVISVDKAREIVEINFDRPLKVHLKIDTGLNRLGIENSDIAEVVRILKSHRNIIIEGVYSHLASVEENDLAYAKEQIKNFKEAIKILKQNDVDDIIKHIAATAATMLLKDSHFDMVRSGIGIYGLWPSKENKETFASDDFLKPVMIFKTQIVQIKKVKKGEKIGYGCAHIAKDVMTIGIIPVGYYEGLDRGLSDIGEVIVSGTRCPIIGRICMNMTIVDVSTINPKSELRITNNMEVTIIGRQAGEEITVDEIAEKIGTINYEIVTRIPAHINRNYV